MRAHDGTRNNNPMSSTTLTHTPSAVEIFHSKEYARFNMISGNRELNELKIKRIKRDIQSGLNVLMYCPIICEEKNGRLNIIDGQHRFWVAKELKSQVWYVLAKNIQLMDIAKMNSNTEKWKNQDFINCFVQQGNKHYIELRDFMEEYGFPVSVSVKLLKDGHITADGSGGGSDVQAFQSGRFEATSSDKAFHMANCIKQFDQFEFYKARPFAIAISRIVTAAVCDFDMLVAKFKKDPSKLTKQGTWKDYLVQLEAIYNLGLHTRKTIF